MNSGIYKIYNKKNHRYYIGQSVNVESRLQQHKRELKDNIHINSKLQSDYNQYGGENFIFKSIYSCEEEFLNAMEKYFIDKYDSLNNGYNIADVSTFVKAKTKENLKLSKLKREFEELEKIIVAVDVHDYIMCKFETHINSLPDLYRVEAENIDFLSQDGVCHQISDFVDNASYKDLVGSSIIGVPNEYFGIYQDNIESLVCKQIINEFGSVIEIIKADEDSIESEDEGFKIDSHNLIYNFHWRYKKEVNCEIKEVLIKIKESTEE